MRSFILMGVLIFKAYFRPRWSLGELIRNNSMCGHSSECLDQKEDVEGRNGEP